MQNRTLSKRMRLLEAANKLVYQQGYAFAAAAQLGTRSLHTIYLIGIPYLRTAIWLVGAAGLGIIAVPMRNL